MSEAVPFQARPAAWICAYMKRFKLSDPKLGALVWPCAPRSAAKERIRSMRNGTLADAFKADIAKRIGVDASRFYAQAIKLPTKRAGEHGL